MRILQIATAPPGWYAAFKLPDGTRVEQPIPLWGLVKYDNNPEPKVQALTTISEITTLLPVLWPGPRDRFIEYFYRPDNDISDFDKVTRAMKKAADAPPERQQT